MTDEETLKKSLAIVLLVISVSLNLLQQLRLLERVLLLRILRWAAVLVGRLLAQLCKDISVTFRSLLIGDKVPCSPAFSRLAMCDLVCFLRWSLR
jgi:hypothetical protein